MAVGQPGRALDAMGQALPLLLPSGTQLPPRRQKPREMLALGLWSSTQTLKLQLPHLLQQG